MVWIVWRSSRLNSRGRRVFRRRIIRIFIRWLRPPFLPLALLLLLLLLYSIVFSIFPANRSLPRPLLPKKSPVGYLCKWKCKTYMMNRAYRTYNGLNITSRILKLNIKLIYTMMNHLKLTLILFIGSQLGNFENSLLSYSYFILI